MLREPWRWSYKLPRGAGDNMTKSALWVTECMSEKVATYSRDRQLSSVERWQALQWNQAEWVKVRGSKGASWKTTRAWQLMVSDLLLCEGQVSDSGCLLVWQGKGEIMDLVKGQQQNLMYPNNSATPYIGFWFLLGKFLQLVPWVWAF